MANSRLQGLGDVLGGHHEHFQPETASTSISAGKVATVRVSSGLSMVLVHTGVSENRGTLYGGPYNKDRTI